MAVRTASRYKHRAVASSRLTLIVQPSREILLARTDLAALGKFITGKDAADIHRSWFPYLVTGQSNHVLDLIAGEDTEILSPRGFGKTFWSRVFAGLAIGNNPHIQTGWISYSEVIALKSSRVIKRLIAHPRYQEVFPWIRPGDRWSDREWEIDKSFAGVSTTDSDATFTAIGATGAVVSNRFHLLYYDDLIKSSASIANEEVREKMLTNIQEAIQPCKIPGGREIDLGTRFRRDDVHATYFKPENGWQVIEQSAVVENEQGDEQSTWPERFSLDFLQAIRERNPVVFLYQFQNKLPPPDEDAIIKPEWIRYAVVPNSLDDLLIGCDLAASETERGDWTAFVVIGVKDGNYTVLEVDRFRAAGNLDKFDRLVALHKRWSPLVPSRRTRVGVERVAYQASFAGDWKRYAHSKRISAILMEEFVPKGDKLQRLEGVSGVFANGFVLFNKDRPMQQLVNELLMLTIDHDDCRDGLVTGLSVLQRRARRRLSSA